MLKVEVAMLQEVWPEEVVPGCLLDMVCEAVWESSKSPPLVIYKDQRSRPLFPIDRHLSLSLLINPLLYNPSQSMSRAD